MTLKCPNDGGFIGEAGCTHPNHEHSKLVNEIINAEKPYFIDPEEADKALNEGFYVQNQEGKNVGFGKNLLKHIESHDSKDAIARKKRLLFAIQTVKTADIIENNHKDIPGRTAYMKAFENFGMICITDKSDNIEYTFTIIPKRKEKKG